MRVLLTGASGFIGSVVNAMLSGYNVMRVVRKKTCSPDEVYWDYRSPFPELFVDIDVIVHLGAIAHFGQTIDPEMFVVNTQASIHLANFAQCQGAGVIFASSVSVHSPAAFITSSTPIFPNSQYGVSKLLAEVAFQEFAPASRILRIGGVYGLDGPEHLGLNKGISRAFHYGESPVLFGSGAGLRNYLSVDDVARWIFHEVESLILLGRHEIRYLASPEQLSLREYLEAIGSIVLGGKMLEEQEGFSSVDFLVEPSVPPFEVASFEEYLMRLATKKNVI